MKEEHYKRLLKSRGIYKLKTDLAYFTCKNMELLYQESNILSKDFVINPYIFINHDPENESSVLKLY